MTTNINSSIVKATVALCTLFAVLWTPQMAHGQITFDFDDATISASGGDVLQTVSVGGVDFQLTASYVSGAGASLFDVGGGDLAFFSNDSSLGGGVTGFRLSLTQDGAATNFDLNQVGFVSFDGGFGGNAFDILNNNGDLITNEFFIQGQASPPAGTPGNVLIGNVVNATNVQFVDFIGNNNFSTVQTDFNNIVVTPTAVPEPGGILLFGLLSIGLLTRRNRS